MSLRIPPTLVAAAASVGLVASWPFVQMQWQGHEADQVRRDLVAQVEAQPVSRDRSVRPARRERPPVAVTRGQGEAFATMRIARFGQDWQWPLLEGTAEEVIASGPGHYLDTALPGAVGNVGIAAHRAGHGDPFIDFDDLRPGDEVEITQGRTTWTYSLTTSPEIVPIDAVWVLDQTKQRTLTLTTCWPKYGSSKRMYVHADLSDVHRSR